MTSQSPAILAVAGAILLVLAAVALLHRGNANPRPAAVAASPRHATMTASPSGSPRRSASPRPAMQSNPFGVAARSYLATRSGTVLAAVYDARTGQTWTLGQGKPQAEASIVKLDILETLLAQHRANGAALPAQDRTLAQAMIEDSDNDAATSLWYEVGGAPGISSFNASAGLVHTTPSSCVNCPGFPWPGWGLTTTTPADQIALLRELLQPNAQLTDAQREYALGLMENVTDSQRWGVTGGVPLQATVALKNGWLPLTSADDDWQINSIGWVSGTGRNYLMAVLTTEDPTEQYGIDTIDQLSAIVWSRMR
jgi:Beta-lactamase enzyme family